ncbi:hypothetical protein [Novispirillum itersonii]|uniref:hypothetical protein n=1 Tax=Novispirillum itersonii TaxID=189 RepID=UPI00035F4DEE|nr:hypothetical protein [Novispirillum itersonii]
MSKVHKTSKTEPSSPDRKIWKAPKLEIVSVAERTNKKQVPPSDGQTAHTPS